MNDWYQWTIIAFVVLSILWHVWKGGASNPESTGSLGRKVSNLSGEVNKLGGRVGHVEAEMKDLKQEAATTKDVLRIEERINTVRAEIEGHRALSQATNESVRRIERVLIEKSLK
jgi:hypothetical protein